MATLDHWEIDNPLDMAAVWTKLIGQPTENAAETQSQMDVILMDTPIQSDNNCLEVGCGAGRLLAELYRRHRFQFLYGVDSSLSMQLAGNRYLSSRIPDISRVKLLPSDGLHLPFADNIFGFVFSFTVLQHQRSLALVYRMLAEIHRVLLPTGLARLQTVASGDLPPNELTVFDGRVFRGTEDFRRALQSVGFRVINCQQGLTHEQHLWATVGK